jgi:hypothetical protein
MRIMSRTDAGRQPQLRVSDPTETADLRVAVRLGSPLVVEIRGEIDIQSAAELRDELLRVISLLGLETAFALGPQVLAEVIRLFGGRPWSPDGPPG